MFGILKVYRLIVVESGKERTLYCYFASLHTRIAEVLLVYYHTDLPTLKYIISDVDLFTLDIFSVVFCFLSFFSF